MRGQLRMQKFLLMSILLLLTVPNFSHADTRVAAQLGSDANTLTTSHWGTRFTAAASTVVHSIALGVTSSCHTVQIGHLEPNFTPDKFVSDGQFDIAQAIDGGYRWTGASVALEAGKTYYILHGAAHFPCPQFTIRGTASTTLSQNAQIYQVANFGGYWLPIGANQFGYSLRDIVYSVCSDTDCALTPPPTCTQDCYSNVLFLPGTKGSVLASGSDILWPPTPLSNDISQLTLDASGESVHDIHVDGILNTFDIGPFHASIYAPFSDFMDSLVTAGTINAWEPFPYDWRFSPEKIIEEGVKTRSGTLDLVHEVEVLAEESRTGKVTIVAHSMGGLVGKALIKKLEEEGKDDLIDSFVMVGTPQLGTPQAVGVLLHGDSESIGGGIIVNPVAARAIAQNMPGAYDLLPSPSYFDAVPDPVISFDPASTFTHPWIADWGTYINHYNDFLSFMTGAGVTREPPPEELLRVPEVLDPNLMANAADFHNIYDNYLIPSPIRVVQVVGWGRPTMKAIEYTESHFVPSYRTLFTTEGDKTVVYPSAIASVADETYYFDIFEYNKALNNNAQHSDLLNTAPLQSIVQSIITNSATENIDYLNQVKPEVATVDDQLVVSTHSPVVLGVYDNVGNFTGIDTDQDFSTGILISEENIPGSTFLYSSEGQFIFLPKTGSYHFVYRGIGDGPTTINIEGFANDETTPIATYSDIPTTENTSASFDVDSSAPENTRVEVDTNSDGEVDKNIFPDGTELPLAELVTQLRDSIQTLISDEKIREDLLKKIGALEKKIENKKQKNGKILDRLEIKVNKQGMKGKIDAADADEIVALLDELEVQAEETLLDANVLAELKDKIESLDIKGGLKKDLVKRVERLEHERTLTNTLANLAKKISKKGGRGEIDDVATQELLNLIDQIEDAL